MAFLDPTESARSNAKAPPALKTPRAAKAPPAPGKELFAAILLAVLVLALVVRHLLPAEALAPAVVTALFAISAVTIGLAWLCRRDRTRTIWLDLGGALTFIGIVLSALIEPDQMVGLINLKAQPE